MSINYQNSSFVLVYDGICYELFKNNLRSIDDLTMSELTKISLLKKLLSVPFIDIQKKALLEKIYEDLPNDYMLEDEYNKFDFFVTVKDSSTEIILPVLYEQYRLDNDTLVKTLSTDQNLIEVLKLYSKKIETDPNNKVVIYDIISNQQKIIMSDLIDELVNYNELDQQVKAGIYLEHSVYLYYKNLKSILQSISSRDELISKFVSNIRSSHYKKRSLSVMSKFYDGKLSKFAETIILSSNNEYENLIGTLLYKTKVLKK